MMKAQLPATAAQRTCRAFTLVELLVSLAVLVFIILLVAQMLGPASAITGTGNKHIDTDTQARVVLDRIAVDFAQMLRRTDIDYYLKAPTGYKNPNSHGKNIKLTGGAQKGNDQMAFFSQTPGYNDTSSSWQSPISLVAYRVNGNPSSPSYLMLERMGKGLLWNGVSNTTNPNAIYPIVFLPGQIAAGNSPWNQQWYAAVNNDNSAKSSDLDYQTIGPGVFRLEYYYLRKDGSIKDVPALTWDNTQTVSANLNAFSDVESIVVAIAVIDPATRSMISPATLVNMMSDMADFKDANGNGIGAQKIGDLENNWNLAVQNAASTGATSDGSPFPPAAASAIRIYNRYFDLRTPAQF
jgi:competence protein ComGC